MFFNRLSQARHRVAQHPGVRPAFAFFASARLRRMKFGHHSLDGKRLLAMTIEADGCGRAKTMLKTHRRFRDSQLTLAGMDEIGWRPIANCREPLTEFDPESNVQFFRDPPEVWLRMPVGRFAMFFPHDAYAALASSALAHRAVLKVAVDW